MIRWRSPAESWPFAMHKWNPLWWFLNSREPTAPADYHPTWPKWLRDFAYSILRNPLNNFLHFVVGISDKEREYVGNVNATYRTDRDESGWVLLAGRPSGSIWWRPWISYTGKRLLWGIGWKNSGQLGGKVTILRSSVQVL